MKISRLAHITAGFAMPYQSANELSADLRRFAEDVANVVQMLTIGFANHPSLPVATAAVISPGKSMPSEYADASLARRNTAP